MIAQQVGVSRPTVIGWRERYQERGLAGLVDEARSGGPYPRILDTGCDYAAVGSVAVVWTEPRGVVGFEVISVPYSPLSMAAW